MSLKIDQLRQLSLELVLNELGCVKKTDHKNKWRTPDGDFVTVDGEKFFNHDSDEGGGGAIDAVQAVTSWSFGECIAWLRKLAADKGEHIDYQENKEIQLIMARELVLPVPSAKGWNQVYKYLTSRSLDHKLIESLHQSGDIFAEETIESTKEIDSYASAKAGEQIYVKTTIVNAVFARRDLIGNITGASRRGIFSDFKAVQGRKDKGTFSVGNKANPEIIAIVESAIDAISYYQCHPKDSLLVISTDGAGKPFMPLIEKYPSAEIVLAQDDDEAGDRMAKLQMDLFLPSGRVCRRERPKFGKDWNDFVTEQKCQFDEFNNVGCCAICGDELDEDELEIGDTCSYHSWSIEKNRDR
jgi:hypothetical protein